MPPKSIWRSADAQHFTLVHRSQRDPLINDPDAPTRVLAATQRRQGKGQPVSRKELEDEFKGKERKNIGEAAQYGVYYDDTDYDYMQHLRPIGGTYNAQRGGKDEEMDVDVVMLPGPEGSVQDKGKARAGGDLTFKDEAGPSKGALDLPQEVLANNNEMPRDWARGTEEEGGLRLDMDPHLRQALEALDDEAFLVGKAKQRRLEASKRAAMAANEDSATAASSSSSQIADPEEADSFDEFEVDGLDDFDDESEFDDLFATVIKSGEYDPDAAADEEWRRLPPGGDEALYLTPADKARQKLQEGGGDDTSLSLTDRVALFKQGLAPGAAVNEKPSALPTAAAKTRKAPSSMGGSSIFGDGPGKKSKPGSKARHAMSFYAPSADGGSTAWSMSSSAMARNAGLRGLDDNFDRLEQIYEQDVDEEDEEDEEGGFVREDFESILDEFLEKHEVIAGKLKQRLGAPESSAIEKLDMIRKEIGQAKIDQWLNEREETQEEIDKDIESKIRIVGLRSNEWDVETIQTTKTNVSNHPRMLSSRGSSVASGSSFRPATLGGLSSRSNGSASNGGSEEFESIPRVRVNPRTGVSEVVGWTKQRKTKADDDSANLPDLTSLSIDGKLADDDDGSGPPPSSSGMSSRSEGSDGEEGDSGDDTETEESVRHTIKRDRNESKEEKKARKEAAKQQKQDRKKEKSERKAEFANERKRQVKMDAGRLKDGGAADVRVGAGRKLG